MRRIDASTSLGLIPAIGPDGALYPIAKLDAHRKGGVLHLAISAFVFSGDELLIQRRAAGKYHCGGQWANTCCSHPHWGESLSHCAARRLEEELGVSVPLEPRGMFDYVAPVGGGLTERERVQVFRGEADRAALRVRPDPTEVSEVRWARRDTLAAEATREPESFAPWFRIYLTRWEELGI